MKSKPKRVPGKTSARPPVVKLDPDNNVFRLTLQGRETLMPPREFEQLVEEVLAASAHHLNSSFEATGQRPAQKDEAIDALKITGMEAIADLCAAHIITRVHMGVLSFNLVAPRPLALEYCAQVTRCIERAEADRPESLN